MELAKTNVGSSRFAEQLNRSVEIDLGSCHRIARKALGKMPAK
jgi:hypothetical protein